MCWRSWNRKPLKVKIHRPEKKNKMTRSNRADRATFFPSLEGFTRARFDGNSIAGAHVKLGADGDGGRELPCRSARLSGQPM